MECSETEELTPLRNSQNHVLEEADLLSEDTHHHHQQQQQQQPQQPQDVQQISEQQNESPSQGVNQFIVNMTGNFTGPIQINTDQGQGTQVVHVASQGKVPYFFKAFSTVVGNLFTIAGRKRVVIFVAGRTHNSGKGAYYIHQ